MKIDEDLQVDLNIIPTQMFWKKIVTSNGEFTLLIVTTTVGSWGFFMPRRMVLDLEKGMHEMASELQVVHTMPTAPVIRVPDPRHPNGRRT